MQLKSNIPISIPLSLYIHFPWCLKKCPYCDFNSYKIAASLPEQEYIATLITDLKNDLPKVSGRNLVSIFFGGGTPSLFSAQGIDKLLTMINSLISIDHSAEITLETNPSTMKQKHLDDYKQAGINRISLGVQSFQKQKLQVLGRLHTIKEIITSIEKIKKVDFASFNIDLMHNLPNQSIADAMFDLKTAVSFAPKHISWYELTIEPETSFAQQHITQPNENISSQIQAQGYQLLQQAGFKQYEISAFAKPQHACLHNDNYWKFGDYLGIGAGAHSKITDHITHTIYRIIKKKTPQAYLNNRQNFIEEEKILSPKQIPLEFMLNALRLTNGFEKILFQERTNLPLSDLNAILEKASNLGLLTITTNKIIPSTLGKRFLNTLLQLFIE